jgi:hypothetical protein
MTTEATMIAAHKAGIAYWRMNRPHSATQDNLASHARSCGWHGEDTTAWLAGYNGERRRMEDNHVHA